MRVNEKVRKTVQQLAALVCDKCGKRIEADDVMEMQETLTLVIHGGYASVLGDGSIYDLDLCQGCVSDVLGPYLRLRVDPHDHDKGAPPPSSDIDD
jgi:hypothetical protein